MTTLVDYTRTEFPDHTLEVWSPHGWTVLSGHPEATERDTPAPTQPSRPPAHPDDRSPVRAQRSPGEERSEGQRSDDERAAEVATMPLVARTVVAHVVGSDETIELLRSLRAAGFATSTAVLVRPIEPTVAPNSAENSESTADLPDRRVAAAATGGGVVGALALGAVGWLVGDEVATGVISAGFGAMLGAVVGSMLGGLGRHAGDQAWSQPHAPGRTVGVVAVFADDDRSMTAATRAMEEAEPQQMRILSERGAWRLPRT